MGFNSRVGLSRQSRIDLGTTAQFEGSILLGENFTVEGDGYFKNIYTGSINDSILSISSAGLVQKINIEDKVSSFLRAGTGIKLDYSGLLLTITNTGVTSFNGRTGSVSPTSGDYNTDLILEGSTNKYYNDSLVSNFIDSISNVANGVVRLNNNTKIDDIYLSRLAITDVEVVNNEAEMLALDVQKGDVAKRLDNGNAYILKSEPASILSNWILLGTGSSSDTLQDVMSRDNVTSYDLIFTNTTNTKTLTFGSGSTNTTISLPSGNGRLALFSEIPTNLSQFINDLGNYGNWITKVQGDTYYYPLTGNPSNYLTSVNWVDVIGRPTALSQFTNDVGYITSADLSGFATETWVNTNFYNKTESDGRYKEIGWFPTFAEVTSKPTTISGYGITDAYTKTEQDVRYAYVGGTNAVGTWTINILGSSGNSILWDGNPLDMSLTTTINQLMVYDGSSFRRANPTALASTLSLGTLAYMNNGDTLSSSITGNASTATQASNSTNWGGYSNDYSDVVANPDFVMTLASGVGSITGKVDFQSWLQLQSAAFLTADEGATPYTVVKRNYLGYTYQTYINATSNHSSPSSTTSGLIGRSTNPADDFYYDVSATAVLSWLGTGGIYQPLENQRLSTSDNVTFNNVEVLSTNGILRFRSIDSAGTPYNVIDSLAPFGVGGHQSIIVYGNELILYNPTTGNYSDVTARNFIGKASNSALWEGQIYDATGLSTGNIIYLMGYNGSTNKWSYNAINDVTVGNATRWDNQVYDGTGASTGDISFLMGYNGVENKWSYNVASDVQDYLNINNGSTLNNNISGNAATATTANNSAGWAGFALNPAGGFTNPNFLLAYDDIAGDFRITPTSTTTVGNSAGWGGYTNDYSSAQFSPDYVMTLKGGVGAITLPADLTVGNAFKWNSQSYDSTVPNTDLELIMGYNSTVNKWTYYNKGVFKTALGTTLQDVTDAGNTTTTGAIFGGDLKSRNIFISGASGTDRELQWQTNGSVRWDLYTNTGTESGSNAGSDLYLTRYDDSGNYLGSVFSVIRSSGVFGFYVPIISNQGATFGGNITTTGTIRSALVFANDGICMQRASSSLDLQIARFWDGTLTPLTSPKGDRVAFGNAGGDSLDLFTANAVRYTIDYIGDHDFKSGLARFGNDVIISKGSTGFNASIPGQTKGDLHLNSTGTNGDINSITFMGNGSSVDIAQAGIYVESSGGYGTRMHFGTTDSYGTGAITRYTITEAGNHDFKNGSAAFGGTIIANALGANIRLNNIDANLDGALFAESNGRISLKNWNATRGLSIEPNGLILIEKTSQTMGSSTPNGALLLTNLTSGDGALEFGVDNSVLGYIQSRNRISATFYDLQLNPNGGNIVTGSNLQVGGILISLDGHPFATSSGGNYGLYSNTSGWGVVKDDGSSYRLFINNSDGATTISNLAGSGDRPVFADSSGKLKIGTPSGVTSLTTTGSGVATLVSGVLNIPTPPLSSYIPYTGATTNIDFNNKVVSGISNLTASVLFASNVESSRIYTRNIFNGIQTVTSNYDFEDISSSPTHTTLVDASSGAITIKLGLVANSYYSSRGKIYTIKKIDSSSNNVTVQGQGSELIDNANTFTLIGRWTTVTVQCDGTQWQIVSYYN